MEADTKMSSLGSRLNEDENGLRFRSRAYALRIIRLVEALPHGGIAPTLSKQLLRSGTSVGAHIAEAARAKSRADFISKLEGAMQELEESIYWMELLTDSNTVKPARLRLLQQESAELMGIMVTMVKRTRRPGSVSA